LHASGLAINLWSNATSLLPALGIPASRMPGEPFSRLLLRASGREAAAIELPAQGLPHITVERAELLNALAATLPEDAVIYGVRCTDVRELADDHDLVVVADGAHSAIRPAVAGRPGGRWTWTVWQACITADIPEIPAGAGVAVVRPGLFAGIYRLPGRRITWFAEQPGRKPADGRQLLRDLMDDEDSVLRALAQSTSPHEWIEWRAEDVWPPRRLHRGNIVLVGDAAHAMLPTLGQGACQSIEDAVTLADAAATGSLDQALRRYEAARIPRVRRIVALARARALATRANPASRALPPVIAVQLIASLTGPVLRRLTRPNIATSDTT
jgi:2-polyprenyl-6-methoxyphenol hydroxylase-like FAD-dependent oxidoreductase